MRHCVSFGPFRVVVLLLVGATALAAIACESTAALVPVQIRQALPEQESLSYNLLDSRGAKIGTAAIMIQRQGDSLALSQSYTDLQQHTDIGLVTVDSATMAPQHAHREIHTAGATNVLDVTYSGGSVNTVAVSGNGKDQSHQATISPATYDDAEVFFLMRTLEFTQGYTARFNLVVVDAGKGTISRAAATARVNGTEAITVNGKSFKAWQVELNGAGATSTAWYDTAPDRKLLRYNNARATSIELAGQ